MEPIIVPRSEHPISRKLIDADAVKVLYRLHRAGYQAYLVGGGVRDLLLDRHPKDFDISTDAHPHQVKRLFRNCRLIGRRFRLAHVHFGEKILEVSTFRKRSEPGEDADTEDILIRSDNTFGTAEEDSLRRDFTINGLFYDISNFSLIDYVGGLADLNERMIRTIGDPDIRFREDPVRMIRAVKFAARLDFGIEEETYDAILRQREEILKSARPRLLEEIYRLLGGGAAVESFRLMFETGLLDILIPEVADFIETHGGVDGTAEENPLWGWLGVLDKRKAAGVALANPLLLGALLSSLYESRAGAPAAGAETDDDGAGEAPGWVSPEEMLRPILADLVVPRRDTEKLMQIFRMQRRFTGQRSRRFSPRAFVTKSYFRDAFTFFEIGVEATGREVEALARWQTLAEQAPPSSASAGAGEPRRRRRRRRRRGGSDEEGGFEMENGQEWSDDPEEVLAAAFADGESEVDDEPEAAPRLDELDDDDDDEDALAARLDADAATGEFQEPAPPSRSARGERTRSARSSEDAVTPRPGHGGHATGARAGGERGRRDAPPIHEQPPNEQAREEQPRGPRPGGERGRREAPPREAHPRDGLPRESRPRDEQRPPAPAPPARPPRGDDDDDEDSQIRFLGWSDQPAILNPRAHAEEPVPNPYLKDRRGGGGGPRRGDSRGPGGRSGEGRGGRGGRGRPGGGYGGERSGGSPGYHSRGAEAPRDGQPGGRDPRGGGPRGGGGRRPSSGRDGRTGDFGGRGGPGPRKDGGFGGGEGRGRDPRGGFSGGGGGYSGGSGNSGDSGSGTGAPRPQGGGARRRGRRSRRRD